MTNPVIKSAYGGFKMTGLTTNRKSPDEIAGEAGYERCEGYKE
jgi:hypothetical protein